MSNAMTTAAQYDYPANGAYADTRATLADGRVVTVNTQYEVVSPHGHHAADCDQLNKIGGRCTCGLLDGIDVAALVADARLHGKFGAAPVAAATQQPEQPADSHLCPKCHTYCDGDCIANRD